MIIIKRKKRQMLVENFPADITFDIVEHYFNVIKKEFDTIKEDVVFDFKFVSYIDSTGIGKIVQFEKYLNENSKRLYIINVTEPIERLFDFFKLSDILDFSSDDSFLYEKELMSEVYIISDELSADEKNSIRNSVKKNCVFLSSNKIDLDYLIKNAQQQILEGSGHIKDRIFGNTDISEILKECIVFNNESRFEIIYDIIKHHPDAQVRKAVVLYSENIKNDHALLDVLKNSYLNENDVSVRKAIRSVIDKIEQ